jgi:hypothetical protein
MAPKLLTLDEMAHVSAVMLNPEGQVHAALQSSPVLSPFLPLLAAAHGQVLTALPKAPDPRLAKLVEEAMAVDAVHDSLVNSVYGMLTGLSGLSDDGSEYLELRSKLFPEGIAGAANITYEGQAGYAKRFRANLNGALESQLASISAGKKNLLEIVNEWLDAGDRLGQIGQQQQQIKADAAPAAPGAISEARFGWIRIINVLQSAASVAPLSEAQRQAIFATLNEVEAKADQRAARRRASKLEASVKEEIAEAKAGLS